MAASAGCVAPPLAQAAQPSRVVHSAQGDWGLAHAPYAPNGAMPVFAFMHGMGDTPEAECPWFEAVARSRGYLICPRGNTPYWGGAAWTGGIKAWSPKIDGAWQAIDKFIDHKVARPIRQKNTLIGFSNGAWAAAATALSQPGQWQHLVLLSMKVTLAPAKVRAAGIERVVLAAGDLDGSATSMKNEARKLNAGGIPALYMSLGRVGHGFPRDLPSRLERALRWLELREIE